MPSIWPGAADVVWPSGEIITDTDFLDFAVGKDLVVAQDHLEIRPWAPATELRASRLVDGRVQLPTACHKHVVNYPAELVEEARCGRYYAFITRCKCPASYLILTAHDGARCKAAGANQDIEALYRSLQGEEWELRDKHGPFTCKIVSNTIN
jgi:hypothetical protein